MSILKNIFTKKNDDYNIDNIIPVKKKGYQEFTREDLEESARVRRTKSQLKRLREELEVKRVLREMKAEEFEDAISQEERMERLKSLKMENLGAGESNSTEDTLMLHLLSQIMPQNQPQQPQPPQQQPQPSQEPLKEEEWKPQTRFSDEQMKELLNKMPSQVIQTVKNLEEDEILQAYDIMKTM